MSDKVVEGTVVEEKRPLRPQVYIALYLDDGCWFCGDPQTTPAKAKKLIDRYKFSVWDIIHIPAEDSE